MLTDFSALVTCYCITTLQPKHLVASNNMFFTDHRSMNEYFCWSPLGFPDVYWVGLGCRRLAGLGCSHAHFRRLAVCWVSVGTTGSPICCFSACWTGTIYLAVSRFPDCAWKHKICWGSRSLQLCGVFIQTALRVGILIF